MAAIDNTLIGQHPQRADPDRGGGHPRTALGTAGGHASAMKLRLNSTLSTASAAGTDIGTQTSGYTAGGWTSLGACTGTGTPTVIGVPFTTQSFVSSGSPTAVCQLRPDRQRRRSGGSGGRSTASRSTWRSGNTFQVTGGAARPPGSRSR